MKPRLLDLFCGGGGCSRGYYDAGFDVVGVDINPHPNYPYRFIQADAVTFLQQAIAENALPFDAIHASPPCQAHTTMSNRWRGQGTKADTHLNLIPAIRTLLQLSGRVWVIENVPGARAEMRNPITLHGGMFGLGVQRPRLFESNVLLMIPQAPPVDDPIGVYGERPDGRRLATRKDGSVQRAASSLLEASEAMDIFWMDWRELAEAIPPAYTKFIGEQLLAHIPERTTL